MEILKAPIQEDQKLYYLFKWKNMKNKTNKFLKNAESHSIDQNTLNKRIFYCSACRGCPRGTFLANNCSVGKNIFNFLQKSVDKCILKVL